MRITVPGLPQQGEIRLRFRGIVQHDRVLHAHRGLARGRQDQQFGQCIDRECMAWPDRRHVNQLPFQQLDAIVLAQNPGLGQAGDSRAAVSRCRGT